MHLYCFVGWLFLGRNGMRYFPTNLQKFYKLKRTEFSNFTGTLKLQEISVPLLNLMTKHIMKPKDHSRILALKGTITIEAATGSDLIYLPCSLLCLCTCVQL